jgi:hypothetical protein
MPLLEQLPAGGHLLTRLAQGGLIAQAGQGLLEPRQGFALLSQRKLRIELYPGGSGEQIHAGFLYPGLLEQTLFNSPHAAAALHTLDFQQEGLEHGQANGQKLSEG